MRRKFNNLFSFYPAISYRNTPDDKGGATPDPAKEPEKKEPVKEEPKSENTKLVLEDGRVVEFDKQQTESLMRLGIKKYMEDQNNDQSPKDKEPVEETVEDRVKRLEHNNQLREQTERTRELQRQLETQLDNLIKADPVLSKDETLAKKVRKLTLVEMTGDRRPMETIFKEQAKELVDLKGKQTEEYIEKKAKAKEDNATVKSNGGVPGDPPKEMKGKDLFSNDVRRAAINRMKAAKKATYS